MRVINEGIKLSTSYDLKDLYKICEKHDVVSGTVIKFNPEDGFSIDLGNNIIAKMSLEDFEDSKNISLNSAILKVGKNILFI